MSVQERVTIKIPKVLYERIAEIIEGTGFSSVTDFIVYVLRDVISSRSPETPNGLNREEIDAIKKRLKALGYL
jgi:metal-responsive CopG/Arc/MetJ family transcriptional regulator